MRQLSSACRESLPKTPQLKITIDIWKEGTVAQISVLIDLNVILDVFQRREPFNAPSARVLACAEASLIEGRIAAHSLVTLFYLLAKYQSAGQARVVLSPDSTPGGI